MTETIIKKPSWWNKRSTLEKSLLIIVAVITITTLILAIGIILLTTKFPAPKCVTPGCLVAATEIMKKMNKSANPCENFYDFACGNYANNVEIPRTQSSVNSIILLKQDVLDQLRKIIEEPIPSSGPKTLVLAKKFYNMCMNEVNIENQGLESIKRIIDDLGGWPVLEGDNWKEEDFEWKQFIYKLKNKGLDYNHLIYLYIARDDKKPTIKNLQLFQAKLDLPKLFLDKDMDNNILKSYYQYMIETAVIFGANITTAEEELMDAFLFLRNLSKISLSPIELRNASAQYNPMTIDELQKLHPYIPWLEFMNTLLSPSIQVNSTEIIINKTPSYLTKLEELLEKTPKRTIANYIIWTIIKSCNLALPKQVQEAQINYLKSAGGILEAKPRWKTCVETTRSNFVFIISSLYIRKYFDKESKKTIEEIVNYIENIYTELLQKTEWMEEETKKQALEKLKAIERHIAYPEELLDDEKLDDYYKGLKIDENSYLDSLLMMSIFWDDYATKRLHEPYDKKDWKNYGDTTAAGAYYEGTDNNIKLTAGILRGSFFSNDVPNYMNYGAIGSVIGHEITHGFDNEGRQLDKDGIIFDWWDHATEKAFLQKAQCIIDQYSNYNVSEINQNINGELTEGENIADNGGLKQAYLAYNKWLLQRRQNQAEQQLPGLPYTPQQMFWISHATTWCTKYKTHNLKILVTSDVHAPYPQRIIGSVSNRPEFARDFNCPVDSKMNPINKCEVW